LIDVSLDCVSTGLRRSCLSAIQVSHTRTFWIMITRMTDNQTTMRQTGHRHIAAAGRKYGMSPAAHHPILSAPPSVLAQAAAEDSVALHWYDLTCPFSYLGQARSRFLQAQNLNVVDLPFQAHPDVPLEGIHIRQRVGAMYERIKNDATILDLPLEWPPRLPNSRLALSAAEWVRRNQVQSFAQIKNRLFRAHFVEGLDIGDLCIVLGCARDFIGETGPLRESLSSGEAFEWLDESERLALQVGVSAAPAWLIRGKTIRGFAAESEFEPFRHIAS